ncbi:MAG TPA: sugar ABC transporter permease [Actinomycetota bacterium]|jgi:multiple sugar transport system permease protein
MAPWILGFLGLILYPMLSSLYFSFTRYSLLDQPQWIGLDNYVFMFTKDPYFWITLRNTLWIIVVGVPSRVAFGIITAWLLTLPRKGTRTYRTMYFMPSIAPPAAAALAFVLVFQPAFGPVNQILRGLGMREPPLWFYGPGSSKWGLVLLGLWGIGDAMIIFLAGLLNVPRQLYEAADIEGANGRQKFRHVTLPMISPVIFFSTVIGIIYGFQLFTQAYVASVATSGSSVTDVASNIGSPQNSMLFFSVYLYKTGFQDFRMGYASALAWVLFVITMVCTLTIIKGSRRWVFYQGGGFR